MNPLQCVVEESFSKTACQMRLSGDLNISNAQLLHQSILSTCEKYPQVDLQLHDVTAFDVAAIQILLSAQRESATQVTVRMGENTDCVRRWLRAAGLSDIFVKQVA